MKTEQQPTSSLTAQKKTTLRGMICTLSGGICWGFSGTCGQYLLQYYEIDAFWLTAMRMLTSGTLLLIFLLLSQPASLKLIWQNKTDVGYLFSFALIGLLSCQVTYLKAIQYTNAGTATVLQYLGPLLIMMYTCLKSRRLPSGKETLAILFALSGTFLLATHGNIHSLAISPLGLFWGLCAAIGLFLYTLLPTGIIAKYGSKIITGYGMFIGGIFLALAIQIWQVPILLDTKGILALFAIILIGTLAAFTLYLQGVQDIGAVNASMLASVEPVAATLFSALWLHSSFAPLDFIGFLLIITTVFLLAKSN